MSSILENGALHSRHVLSVTSILRGFFSRYLAKISLALWLLEQIWLWLRRRVTSGKLSSQYAHQNIFCFHLKGHTDQQRNTDVAFAINFKRFRVLAHTIRFLFLFGFRSSFDSLVFFSLDSVSFSFPKKRKILVNSLRFYDKVAIPRPPHISFVSCGNTRFRILL